VKVIYPVPALEGVAAAAAVLKKTTLDRRAIVRLGVAASDLANLFRAPTEVSREYVTRIANGIERLRKAIATVKHATSSPTPAVYDLIAKCRTAEQELAAWAKANPAASEMAL